MGDGSGVRDGRQDGMNGRHPHMNRGAGGGPSNHPGAFQPGPNFARGRGHGRGRGGHHGPNAREYGQGACTASIDPFPDHPYQRPNQPPRGPNPGFVPPPFPGGGPDPMAMQAMMMPPPEQMLQMQMMMQQMAQMEQAMQNGGSMQVSLSKIPAERVLITAKATGRDDANADADDDAAGHAAANGAGHADGTSHAEQWTTGTAIRAPQRTAAIDSTAGPTSRQSDARQRGAPAGETHLARDLQIRHRLRRQAVPVLASESRRDGIDGNGAAYRVVSGWERVQGSGLPV